MEIWRAIFCKTLNWCFECTHGSNEHAEHTWKRYKPFIITPTWRSESLGWRHHTRKLHSRCNMGWWWLSGGYLAEVMDSETGLLQVHLLCSGSGAKTAWQWRDTKSLPVKEAGGRPPIKTHRLWVTFHRAQLLGCDSMPTHYSWRVVCLVCVRVCVTTRRVSLLELCLCMCILLPHCFSASHYLTTLIFIFYAGSLSESSILISSAEGVEKWTCASFLAQIIHREREKHQK